MTETDLEQQNMQLLEIKGEDREQLIQKLGVKDESTFHNDMINQILILPSIFSDLDQRLKSVNILNAVQLYKYFS